MIIEICAADFFILMKQQSGFAGLLESGDCGTPPRPRADLFINQRLLRFTIQNKETLDSSTGSLLFFIQL